MSGTVLGTRWDLERGRCGEGAGDARVQFLQYTAELSGDLTEQWLSTRRFCPQGSFDSQHILIVLPGETTDI